MSKRRRRKRKKTTSDGAATAATTKTPETIPSSSSPSASAKSLARELLAQEQIMYDQDEDLTAFIPQKLEEDDRISAAASKAGFAITGGKSEGGIAAEVEDLFDSREFLQRKREKQLEELGQWDSDGGGVPTKKKIKRSDVKAYTRLLEMDPLADEDDSYFEDEEGVDVISALLGDVERGVGSTDVGLQNQERDGSKANAKKKTSFLGIGSGPLQVGHFIGSLGVILMAFVEYPGFPLTNLPDPLRGALQGGEFAVCCCSGLICQRFFLKEMKSQSFSLLFSSIPSSFFKTLQHFFPTLLSALTTSFKPHVHCRRHITIQRTWNYLLNQHNPSRSCRYFGPIAQTTPSSLGSQNICRGRDRL